MDGTAAPRPAGTAEPGENLRMLAELESSARPMERSAGRISTAWIAAVALLLAGAGAWWFSQQGAATAPERPITRTIAAAPVTEAAKPALPASAASAAAATTARIEAMPEPPTASQAAATVAAKASELAASPPVAQASAAAAPAKPRPTRLAAAPSKRAASGAGASTRSAATSTTRSAAAPTANADRSNNRDADIVLLSALLAHVSRDGQAGPLASNDQSTIAQIVQRCEARGGEESRQCRRRICEGYWGKAQACPAHLAPKKG
jgi:hypothetical protein